MKRVPLFYAVGWGTQRISQHLFTPNNMKSASKRFINGNIHAGNAKSARKRVISLKTASITRIMSKVSLKLTTLLTFTPMMSRILFFQATLLILSLIMCKVSLKLTTLLTFTPMMSRIFFFQATLLILSFIMCKVRLKLTTLLTFTPMMRQSDTLPHRQTI